MPRIYDGRPPQDEEEKKKKKKLTPPASIHQGEVALTVNAARERIPYRVVEGKVERVRDPVEVPRDPQRFLSFAEQIPRHTGPDDGLFSRIRQPGTVAPLEGDFTETALVNEVRLNLERIDNARGDAYREPIAKKQYQESREILAQYRAHKRRAQVFAVSELMELTPKFPKKFLRQAPFSSLYLMAREGDEPGVTDKAVEAWRWLESRYGELLSVKGASTILDPRNRKEFDRWANDLIMGRIEAGKLPEKLRDRPSPRQLNAWAQGVITKAIEKGQLPKELQDQEDQQEAWRRAIISEAQSHGGLPAGILSEGPIEQQFGRVIRGPGREVRQPKPLTWTVDQQWALDHPDEFAFALAKVRQRFPDIRIKMGGKLDTIEFNIEKEEPGTFATLMTAFNVGWDTLTSPASAVVRFGGETVEFLRPGGDNSFPTPLEVYREVVPETVRRLPEIISGGLTEEEAGQLVDREHAIAGLRLGQQIATVRGLKPSDPGYDSAVLWGSILGDFALSWSVGGIWRGLRLARTVPIGATAEGRAIVAKSISKNPFTRATIRRVGMLPDELAETSWGREAIDTIWNMVKADPENAAVQLLSRFGRNHMTPSYARLLSKARSRDDVMKVVIDGLSGGGRTLPDIKSIRGRLAQIHSEVQNPVTELMETRRVGLDDALKAADPNFPLDAIAQQRDRINALKEGMRRDGFIEPIRAKTQSDGSLIITDGHHRLQAARELNLPDVPIEITRSATQLTDVPSLLAEKVFLESRLQATKALEFIPQLPVMKFWRDAVKGFNTSPIGRAVLALTDGVRVPGSEMRILRMNQWWEHLPSNFIHSPFHPTAPGDAAQRGFENLQRMMRRLGVSESDRLTVLRKWLDMDGPDGVFDVMETLGKAVENSPALDPLVSAEVGRFFKTRADDLRRGLVENPIRDADGRLINVVEDTLPVEKRIFNVETGQYQTVIRSAPAWPTELIAGFPLPSHRELHDASSFVANTIMHMTRGGARGKAVQWTVGQAIQQARRGLDVVNFIWKRAVLMAKLPFSLPMRIQSEQMFRLAAYDYSSLVSHPIQWIKSVLGKGEYARFTDDVDEFLGSLVRSFEDDYSRMFHTGGPQRVTYRAGDLATNPRPYLRAWADRLRMRSQDPFARILAREGPEGLKRFLTKSETGKTLMGRMQKIVDDSGLSLDGYIQRLEMEIRYLTRGDKYLRGALHRGTLDFPDDLAMETPEPLDRLRSRGRTLSRDIRDIQMKVQRGELQLTDELQQTLQIMRDELKGYRKVMKQSANLEHTDDVADIIEWMVDTGRVQPAPEIVGDIFKAERGINRLLSHHPVRRFADASFRHFYTNPDLLLTRRSLFRQIARRDADRLVGLGVTRGRARQLAMRTAAHKASDMMYDLAARTSGQFFMRNAAPFFPAWQEIANTWALRIPNAIAGPGFGHAILVDRVQDIISIGKETGIIQTNPITKEDVIIIPGLDTLLENILGIKSDLRVAFPVKGLNLVASGLFGLGPLHAIAVAESAKRFGGIFETFADVFLPFGLEISVGPSAVNRFAAAAFGGVVPWEFATFDYQKMMWDHAVEDGMILARQNLGPPPKMAKRLIELNRKVELTQAEENELAELELEYQKNKDNYLEAITSKGQAYARTYYIAKGLSGMLLPAVIKITPDFVEERTKFWEEFNNLADSEDRGLFFAEFLEEHPNMSWALNPKTKVVAGEVRSEFTGDKDDFDYNQYLADLRNNKIEELGPERFMMNSYAIEGYRQYQRRRMAVTDSFGSARNILLNLNDYWDKLQDYTHEFDLFEAYNPEAQGIGEQIRNDTALGKDDRLIRSRQEERVLEFTRLGRELADFFTNEFSVPDTQFRAVMAKANDILGDGEFGEPRTPIEKALSWWWSTQGRPYFDKRQEMIEETLALPDDEQGEGWNRVRLFADKQRQKVGPPDANFGQVEPLKVFVESDKLTDSTLRAMNIWNRATGTEIVQIVANPDDAEVVVRVEPKFPKGEGAEFSPADAQIRGERKALRDPITMAHEMGHALGLGHLIEKHGEALTTLLADEWPKDATVANIGLMGVGKGGKRAGGPIAIEIAKALSQRAKEFKYPTPEEVAWNMMSPEQQRLRKLTLTTRRMEWLTRFERKQVGYEAKLFGKGATEKKVDQYVDFYNKEWISYQREVRNRNLHPSSTEAQALRDRFDSRVEQKAKGMGQGITNFWMWQQGEIFQRLNAFGTMKSEGWGRVTKGANIIIRTLQANELSPSGGSQLAMFYYDWWSRALNKERRRDPELDEEFTRLSAAMNMNKEQMYLAVFFGRFPF